MTSIEKCGVHLTENTHHNGVVWFQVCELETNLHAAALLYEGSDREKAECVFNKAVSDADISDRSSH